MYIYIYYDRCIYIHMYDYDVIVIGAGAAGITAAKNLMVNGKRVILLEGFCINLLN